VFLCYTDAHGEQFLFGDDAVLKWKNGLLDLHVLGEEKRERETEKQRNFNMKAAEQINTRKQCHYVSQQTIPVE
jgi:hypothetical protein